MDSSLYVFGPSSNHLQGCSQLLTVPIGSPQVLLGSLSSVLSAMITQPNLYHTAEHVVLTESRFKLTQILHTEAFWNNVNTSHPPKLLHVL